MRKNDLDCITWKDAIKGKGIASSTAESLIGFVSWNRGEIPDEPGKHITEALSGYEGKVFAVDVFSRSYNDAGIMFFKNDIPKDEANNVFDKIMEYEQENVYKM